MSHREQMLFVNLVIENLAPSFPTPRILEIGSYNVNGAIRSCFERLSPKTYIGLDLTEGPGVDVVCSGHLFNGEQNSVDIAISCECFEHNPHWIDTFRNMVRMTRPGGLVMVSCASRGRVEHGTLRAHNPAGSPGTSSIGSEYYHNITTTEFLEALHPDNDFRLFRAVYSRSHRDLYFIGIKSGESLVTTGEFENVVHKIKKIEQMRMSERGLLKTALREIALNIPLGLMSNIFPHELFQQCALRYKAALRQAAGVSGKNWLNR